MPGWFVRDQSEETDAAIREEFVRALAGLPQWAIHQAFDQWVKTEKRRPCPAEIVELAHAAIAPITRKISQSENALALAAPPPQRVSAERAAEILAAAGFRPRKFTDEEKA